MLKDISTFSGSFFPLGYRNAQNRQNTNIVNGRQAPPTERTADRKKANSIRRMLSEDGQTDDLQAERNVSCSEKIAESSFNYADSLRAARTKAKNTALKLKKLRYSYKSISTQIMRSKTSAIAKQVVSRARREVIRLKRQLLSKEYNDEELKCAIVHAQAMVRVAKKKARHLQEEEMVKVTGGPCAAELEEKEDRENQSVEEAIENWEASHGSAASDDDTLPGVPVAFDGDRGDGGVSLQEEVAGAMQEQVRAQQEVTEARMARQQDAMAERQMVLEEQQEMMAELMDETWDSMEEALKSSGLEELAEELTETVEVEMDPADFEMMKIKHRSEEMKAIAEADAEYLKTLFDRLEKEKSAGSRAAFGAGGNTSSSWSAPSGGSSPVSGGRSAGNAAPVPAASAAPAMSAAAMPSAAEVAAGGFDVSV